MSATHGADLARAQRLLALKRTGEALAIVTVVLSSQPDDPAALRLAARCQSALGSNAEALRTAKAAVAADPHSEHGYRILAEVLRRTKSHKAAAEAAAEAVRLAPEEWRAHLTQAQCLLRVDPNAALKAAERACELAPQSADTHYVRGAILRTLRKKEEARAAYRQALAINPQHAQAHGALAILDQSRWGWGGSLRGFRRALSIDPQQRTLRLNLESVILRRLWRLGWLAVIGMQIVSGSAESSSGHEVRVTAVVADAVLVAATWALLWPNRRDLGVFGWRLVRTDRRALACESVVVGAVLLIAACAIAPSITNSGIYVGVWLAAELAVVLILFQLRAMARRVARNPEAL
ncbi:MAG TPA: tetratricopeptide repeat protein [Actinocrinis sp.]|uniref:tetratricopeptide repeat protein n=1 Tax=Actinocrinis sp. TaxID=1920516 RepID=UPI002DDCCCCB|nr:tetratricopeptide repeat protein [Actinocrinis sp.]HEV2345459.1 tetratricopeptide repeat protein [Actinocrinis sp.]